jgi:hypothetical protein
MSLLLLFDFLGKEPEIKLNGHKRYRTAVGGTLSFYVFWELLHFRIFFLHIYSRTKIQINTKDSFYLNLETNLSDISFAYRLTDDNSLELPEADKYFRLKLKWWILDSDGNWTSLVVPSHRCSKDDFKSNEQNIISKISGLDTYDCFNKTVLNELGMINGTFGDTFAENVPIIYIKT